MSGPIRHIVMWTLRGDSDVERIAARLRVKTAFEGLKGRIKGLDHIEIGIDVGNVVGHRFFVGRRSSSGTALAVPCVR